MNLLGLTTLVLIGLLGQDPPEAAEAATAEATPPPEVLRVLTIHATREGRTTPDFDPSLAPLEDYLADLPYDTFRELNFDEVDAAYEVDTQARINDRYTLYCNPSALSEAGEVLFDAHIDLEEPGEAVEALRVSGKAARGQGIVFRGLAMPTGELVVVMSIAKPGDDSGGAGQGQGEGGDTGDGNPRDTEGDRGAGEDGDGNVPPDEDLALDERPDDEEEQDEPAGEPVAGREAESPLPPDMANVEGILRALEEQDMREQKNARNRRYDVIIRGDWW